MAFKDIIGQERAVNILKGTLSQHRIPSAYLFTGESGIGKKFTAINLAKVLNCQKAEHSAFSTPPYPPLSKGGTEGGVVSKLQTPNSELGIDACDACPSCKKIDAQTHPDFLLISPEKGEIRVDEIRTIEGRLSLAPYEGRMKVVIVDDADTMNQSAANAFLKTLEEPPPQSLIILISSSPDMLLETIRSRCSRINFQPLSFEECRKVIEGSESASGGDKTQDIHALLSMGRPGAAISNDLIEEREWFFKLLKEMLTNSKDSWADKEEIKKWFDTALMFLRDMVVLKITGKEEMLINLDMKDKIARISKAVEIKDIIKNYVRLSFLKGYLDFNLNKAITWNYVSMIMREVMVDDS
jgi:DNA polymerase-3 subunit delta'